MAGGSAPRFAPDDPSLPPPWKALVDGNTGYIYYWNTDTNLTQYEKPSSSSGVPPLPPGPPPAPSLPGVAPKRTSLSVVSSSDGKPMEKRSSSGTGMSPSSESNNPGRIEEMHSVVSTTHVSSSGARFSSSGGQLLASHDDFHDNMYVNDSSRAPNRSHIAEHHGRHSLDQHGRYLSDHHSRGSSDHHGGHSSGRSISEHHGGHVSNLRSRSIPESQAGHIPNHHVPEQHGGHMSHHHTRPPVLDRHSGHGGFVAPRAGNAVSGSGSRASGHGMLDGGMQTNSNDSSWGTSSGRPSHGSPLSMKGPPFRNDYDGGGTRSIPKLAALPIPSRQQSDMRGSHYSDQQRQMGHSSSGTVGRSSISATPGASFKRLVGEHAPGGSEFRKRPRLQPFSETGMPPDVQAYRIQHEITVMGDNIPPPFMTFEAANFPAEIIKELCSAGFAAPTPIQAQSWPIAVEKRDIVAIAKTGSGKTLGYLLPAFLHLLDIRANSRAGPLVLVLAPTRELATQIQDEAVKFGRSSRISSTCVYGGAPKGPQIRDLERGADIVIATPGRLNDFLEAKKISLRQVSYLVLDEADRMLDMGFEPQIRKIVKGVPLSRQTLMFTATWPKEVRKIAADLLANAVHVNIGNSDELTANKAITQHVEVVQPFHKQRRLEEILRVQEPGAKVIIFCSTKKMCDQLALTLARGFRAVAIHGDKSQSERDHVLAQFKAGRCPILVATDVAARGLDVKDIRVVINYDFPTGVEDYVHRIGRTGRAGATGEAFTFFSEQDCKFAKELVKILESADQKVPIELRQFAGRTSQSRGRSRWSTGGVLALEESMDGRGGLGPRGESIGMKDARVVSYGYREGAGKNEAAGRWGFDDPGIRNRDVGRDFSVSGRAGSTGDRAGGMGNRDMRIASRVENSASRAAGVGLRGGVVSRRREDMNEPMSMRVGGLTSRESGRNVEGVQKDGWVDAVYNDDNDGWGASSTGSGWGQFEIVRHNRERGGGSKDAWGDTGLGDGSSGMFGSTNSASLGATQPELRGRIFDRLGDRGMPSESSGWKDHYTDGGIGEGPDLKKLIGAKAEIRRRGSVSPGKGWRGSRSPTTVSTKSGSQIPSKDWGKNRSRSRSPGWGWSEMSPHTGWNNSSLHSASPSRARTDRNSPIRGRHSHEIDGDSGSFAQGFHGHRKKPISSPTLHSPWVEKSSASLYQQPSEELHSEHYKEHKHQLEASEDKREESSVGLDKDGGSHPPFQAVQDGADGVSLGSKLADGFCTPETIIQDGKCQGLPPPEEIEISTDFKPYTAGDDVGSVNDIALQEGAMDIKVHGISSSCLVVDENQLSSQNLSAVKGLSLLTEDAFCEQPLSINASVVLDTPKLNDAINNNCVSLASSEHGSNRFTGSTLLDCASGSDINIVDEKVVRFSELRQLADCKPSSAVHELCTDDNIDAVVPAEITETVVSSPEEGMVV